MFRKSESQDFFYKVALSDIETVVLCKNHSEAAATGVEKIVKNFGKNTNISFSVVVEKIDDHQENIEIFDVSQVMEDIGMFSLSKKISDIRDYFLDKGDPES